MSAVPGPEVTVVEEDEDFGTRVVLQSSMFVDQIDRSRDNCFECKITFEGPAARVLGYHVKTFLEGKSDLGAMARLAAAQEAVLLKVNDIGIVVAGIAAKQHIV